LSKAACRIELGRDPGGPIMTGHRATNAALEAARKLWRAEAARSWRPCHGEQTTVSDYRRGNEIR